MKNKAIVYVLALFIVFMTAAVMQTSNGHPSNLGNIHGINYVEHDRISINSDSEFLTKASSEGWQGNGDPGNPIIIEGFKIGHTSMAHFGIFIQDTRLYFEIKNNYIYGIGSGCWCGIHIENISNGKFTNNEFYNGYNGLFLSEASNIEITGNYMHENDLHGVSVTGSSKIVITGNEFAENSFNGIHFFDTEDSVIVNNYVHDNNKVGINFATTSHGCVIEGNNISGNSQDGISYYRSNDLVINNNSITDNNAHGIIVSRSLSCNITNNSITGNAKFGIIITSNSQSNNIKWNNFTDNNVGGISQARNDGPDNVFENNYWSDWDGLGTYYIAFHNLSNPAIAYPTGG
ncbi:MAG: right-handed parallel beta-helix repeat-containing protein, partial [Candidatus Hodarchaeales archaeon]